MKPAYYPAHPALRNVVSHLLVVDVQLTGPAYGRAAPFPPTPQNSLNFYPADPARSRQEAQSFTDLPAAAVIGPQTTRVDLLLGSRHRFVSVAFQPGGLFRLLGIPLPELLDAPFDAADLLGPDLRDVSDQLREAQEPLAMKTVVEAYLLRKLPPRAATPLEQALRLLGTSPAATIDQAVALACLSNRQFERNAKQALGYSPKFFARLARFSRAYRAKVSQPAHSWTAISHQHGYYDQMHLIRDFKEFAATTPRQLTRDLLGAPLRIQADPRL